MTKQARLEKIERKIPLSAPPVLILYENEHTKEELEQLEKEFYEKHEGKRYSGKPVFIVVYWGKSVDIEAMLSSYENNNLQEQTHEIN